MASEFKASISNDMLCEDESESFSDIDDQEIDQYLFNDEEKRFRKIMWENQNREYLEEEAAAKEAEENVYEAIWLNTREDPLESMERYESALAVLARYRERLQSLFEDNPAIDS